MANTEGTSYTPNVYGITPAETEKKTWSNKKTAAVFGFGGLLVGGGAGFFAGMKYQERKTEAIVEAKIAEEWRKFGFNPDGKPVTQG